MDVFGTMDDVDKLIRCVHERQMRIILDLVMNHTSEYVRTIVIAEEVALSYPQRTSLVHRIAVIAYQSQA